MGDENDCGHNTLNQLCKLLQLSQYALWLTTTHKPMHAGTVVNLVHQGVHATMHQYLRSH